MIGCDKISIQTFVKGHTTDHPPIFVTVNTYDQMKKLYPAQIFKKKIEMKYFQCEIEKKTKLEQNMIFSK